MSLVHTNKTLKRFAASNAIRWTACSSLSTAPGSLRSPAMTQASTGRGRSLEVAARETLRYSHRMIAAESATGLDPSAPKSRAPAAMPGAIRRR